MQVVLELQDDGKLTTSDDPSIVFGHADGEFLQKVICLAFLISIFTVYAHFLL